MNGFESAGLARRSAAQDVSNIEQLALILDDETLKRAADLIEQAERILIIGEDLSEPLADLLARSLRTLNYDAVQLYGPSSRIATQFRSLNRNHLVIALSTSAYCPDVTSAVEVARDLKARTLAFAGARSWAVAREADQVITCPSGSPTALPSLTSFAAAINALLQLLAHRRRDEQVEMSMKYNDVLRRLAETHSRVELDASAPVTPPKAYHQAASAFVSQSMHHDNDLS
jgi:DNA-binding MurR/RpiR family transcriptional regulator